MNSRLPKFQLTKRQWIGLAFIYLAGIGWLVEFIVPFTHINNKGTIWVIILAGAEVSFLIGIAILGKPTYNALKDRTIKAWQGRNRP